jgi:glucose-1-phosphate adenylyltransferase
MPSAKFAFDDAGRRGEAIDSLVSAGCILSGARVKRSVISTGTFLHSYASVKDSVVLPLVEIGRNCRISKAIIDKACIVPPNTIIGENLEEDRKRFYVDDAGIVLVTPEMLGQQLHVVR